MDILTKLHILADSAKYDVSCASSGSDTKRSGKVGSNCLGGICHSWSADGRCISLLKILLTNICVYDCAYCINRRSNDVKRAIFTPREIAQLTMSFYLKNYIEGLFLSSAVVKNADVTMELLIRSAKLLREEHQFRGYIHLKLIPGASESLVAQAGRYADRLSVNIELPSEKSLTQLAPEKNYPDILTPMTKVRTAIAEARDDRKKFKTADSYSPAGQSTQLIVGASPESDLQIMTLSEQLYDTMKLKRVYYSAYIPVNKGGPLPATAAPSLAREHRLYQADWLLRFYGFTINELLDTRQPNFEEGIDPKVSWALRHPAQFPVEINTAAYAQLLRVPGIGVRSAMRILSARKVRRLRWEDVKRLGVVMKRAKYFITVSGRQEGKDLLQDPVMIKRQLVNARPVSSAREEQLLLFPSENTTAISSAITGEL